MQTNYRSAVTRFLQGPPIAGQNANIPLLAGRRGLLLLLAAQLVVWVLARSMADANLDSYGDMMENVAWSQVFELGTFKHPPLFAWVTGAWFAVMPYTDSSYRVLSYLNIAVGLVGVHQLAHALDKRSFALPAVILLAMALPYTTLAAKFNANAILLSVWPWVAVAMLRSVALDKALGLAWSVGLGALAALAMLGKYYSGVFLLGLFLAMFTHASGWRWMTTARPWVALISFGVCLLPHLSWLRSHDFITLKYAADQGTGSIDWAQVLKFALSPLMYWGVPWLLCCIFFAPADTRWSDLGKRFYKSWLPQGWADRLFWLAMSPWLITLGFGLSGLVELSLPWSIPVGFGFSLLWLRNLCPPGSDAWFDAAGTRLGQSYVFFLALVLLSATVLGLWQALSSNEKYYLPREDAAKAILQAWAQRYPDQAPQWVGGLWGENALMAFYGKHTLRVLPGMPDQFPATLSPHANWKNEAGLLLCPLGPTHAHQEAGATCMTESAEWMKQQGQTQAPMLVRVHRSGWRFPRVIDFDYAAFVYLPLTGNAPAAPGK